MKTFRLILEYDGTDFEGWQSQPAPSRTVQSCLGEALEQITGSRPKIVGSGRTDSGVHARGQVACCRLQTRLGVAELHVNVRPFASAMVTAILTRAQSRGTPAALALYSCSRRSRDTRVFGHLVQPAAQMACAQKIATAADHGSLIGRPSLSD